MVRDHQPGEAVFKSICLKTSIGSRSRRFRRRPAWRYLLDSLLKSDLM